MIWKLIKQCMRDTEVANNVQFTDSAWQRFKQLERDIMAAVEKEMRSLGVGLKCPRCGSTSTFAVAFGPYERWECRECGSDFDGPMDMD